MGDSQASRSGGDVVAVVPARGGSKGVVGKNLLEVGGRRLYERAIDVARMAGVSSIVVTTDMPEILDRDHGVDVLLHHRPSHLCGDDVPMEPVLDDVIRAVVPSDAVVVLLQPTSPLRSVDDVERSVEAYRRGSADLVLTVSSVGSDVLKSGTVSDGQFVPVRGVADVFSNRQSLPDMYKPNGSVFVFGAGWFREAGGLNPVTIAAIVTDPARAIDIDDESDLCRAEEFLSGRGDGSEW